MPDVIYQPTIGAYVNQALMNYLNESNKTRQRNLLAQDIQTLTQYQNAQNRMPWLSTMAGVGDAFLGGPGNMPNLSTPFPAMRSDIGQNFALQTMDPLRQAQLQAEKARTAYWSRSRETTGTPSPIQKMVNEGLISPDEGRDLALKSIKGELTEKDIISIMHTIERALASTYTPLNEPLPGPEYAQRREYYAQQLKEYQDRLEKIRGQGEARGILEKAGIKVSEPTISAEPELESEEFPEPNMPSAKTQAPSSTPVQTGPTMMELQKGLYQRKPVASRVVPTRKPPPPPKMPVDFNANRKPHPNEKLKMPPVPTNKAYQEIYHRLDWWSLPSDLQWKIYKALDNGWNWDEISQDENLQEYFK